MSTPVPLSPAAQAVLDAFYDAPVTGGPHGGDALGVAAAIRALVDLAYMARPDGTKFLYAPDLLAIAAELDGEAPQPTPTETPND
jgi:hypothetical protein